MKAFMKVVILTNIGSNKGCHESVVIAINVKNVFFVIASKVLRFISQSNAHFITFVTNTLGLLPLIAALLHLLRCYKLLQLKL